MQKKHPEQGEPKLRHQRKKTQAGNRRTPTGAPSGDYLAMVERRSKNGPERARLLTEMSGLTVNLPGLGGGFAPLPVLCHCMLSPIHWSAGTIRAALLPQLDSAWAAAELEELFELAAEVVTTCTDIPNGHEKSFQWQLRETSALCGMKRFTLGETMTFCGFVIHQHGPVIRREVLPTLPLPQAAYMAEALAIAEAVINGEGTPAEPTDLQRQAWALTARLWMEWPREKSFAQLRGLPGAEHWRESREALGAI